MTSTAPKEAPSSLPPSFPPSFPPAAAAAAATAAAVARLLLVGLHHGDDVLDGLEVGEVLLVQVREVELLRRREGGREGGRGG